MPRTLSVTIASQHSRIVIIEPKCVCSFEICKSILPSQFKLCKFIRFLRFRSALQVEHTHLSIDLLPLHDFGLDVRKVLKRLVCEDKDWSALRYCTLASRRCPLRTPTCRSSCDRLQEELS